MVYIHIIKKVLGNVIEYAQHTINVTINDTTAVENTAP